MNANAMWFERAQRVIPGGVNSPVRSFRSVGGKPKIITQASGAWVTDAEGKRYIDYIGSWGASILGHAHPAVAEAVRRAAENGLSFGAPTIGEVEIAERLTALMPSMAKVRLVNSGTEATMTAIRIARGVTGRDIVVKFDGCYHGHNDSLLVKAGSGALTHGFPDSKGIPNALAALTHVLPYNDCHAVNRLFDAIGDQIAAVIAEPIAGNMNMVVPDAEFLRLLRQQCTKHGTVLIFDEVMSGFRVGLQGAQGLFNIEPDLTTLGKVIGGGMPVGAVGGKIELMSALAPEGPIYQAGTLSGNPLTVAAGLATLNLITEDGFYTRLQALTDRLTSGLTKAAQSAETAFCAQGIGGMFGLYFTDKIPNTSADTRQFSAAQFQLFFTGMMDAGIYIAPSAFEAGFMSAAHDESLIDQTVSAAFDAFRTCKNS